MKIKKHLLKMYSNWFVVRFNDDKLPQFLTDNKHEFEDKSI